MTYVSTRVSGWVQKLYVNFTGTPVKKGAHLLDIYSPELLVAQEEYLLVIKNLSESQASNIEAVRQTVEHTLKAAESRLELLGLTKEQIQDIREHGKTRTELPIYSPIGGTVIHLNVNNGQYVNRGMHLYKIADLNTLWLLADIYTEKSHVLPATHQHVHGTEGQDLSETSSIWTCPMHPQIKRDESGECPICGMDLIEEEVNLFRQNGLDFRNFDQTQ